MNAPTPKKHMGLDNLSRMKLDALGHIVSVYLDSAELGTRWRIPMTMEDWSNRQDIFLSVADWAILQDTGKISAQVAQYHAEREFEKYRIVQDQVFRSDFSRL